MSVLVLSLVLRAGVYGDLSAQGQAQTFEATTPNGSKSSTRSLIIAENLGLHYAGTPFGPNAVMLGAGLQAVNVNGFGDAGALVSGRSATLDVSVGLFPRRALPLRLYARGTLTDGGPQSLATLGGRESLAVGANVHLEPFAILPGLRLDVEQLNFTGYGTTTPLGDVRRTLAATLYKQLDSHQLSATVRVTQEQRSLIGEWLGVGLLGSWTGPQHTTSLAAESVDRSKLVVPLPGAATSMVDRTLRLNHQQRWTRRFFMDASARLADVRFDAASGTQGGATAGVSWQPFEAHELSVSAAGDVGFATTTATTQTGATAGGTGRLGYARAFGPIRAGAFVGGMGQHCQNCVGLTDGWMGSFDVGVAASTVAFERFDAQADYRTALVRAPMGRGGNRTEHHGKLTGRVRLWGRSELYALVGYDDGFRDYIDLTSGGIASLHEQALSLGGGAQVLVWRGMASVDARHVRGNSVIPASPFSLGPPLTAREVTQLSANLVLPVLPWLDAQGGAMSGWTVLDNARPLFTVTTNVGLTARVGRFSSSLTWNVYRNDTQGFVTTQHLVRLAVSRPFDF